MLGLRESCHRFVMCTHLMKEYSCYIKAKRTNSVICYFFKTDSKNPLWQLSIFVDPILVTSQCYFPESWKVYIFSLGLYTSTIICSQTVFILNSGNGKKRQQNKAGVCHSNYHSSALLTVIAVFWATSYRNSQRIQIWFGHSRVVTDIVLANPYAKKIYSLIYEWSTY